MDPLKEVLPIGRADRLQHFDRDDAVIGAVFIAIVAQPDVGR